MYAVHRKPKNRERALMSKRIHLLNGPAGFTVYDTEAETIDDLCNEIGVEFSKVTVSLNTRPARSSSAIRDDDAIAVVGENKVGG